MKSFTVRATALVAVMAFLGVGSYAIAGGKASKVHADPLTSYQEVVSNANQGAFSSVGFGEFEAEVDDETQTITYLLEYAGLEGPVTTQAHIHLGNRYTTGGISAFLCGGGTKPNPCPPAAGTVTGTITPADVQGPTAQGIEPGAWQELAAAIRAGYTYVNVHTSKFPTGEIRAQIEDKNQRQD